LALSNPKGLEVHVFRAISPRLKISGKDTLFNPIPRAARGEFVNDAKYFG
jgi:hypothetical protein